MEIELKRKTEEANKKQEHFYGATEKIKLTENEINFLRNELEQERRKSSVDQNRIKKFESVLNDKEEKLANTEQEYLRRDSDMRDLERALEE